MEVVEVVEVGLCLRVSLVRSRVSLVVCGCRVQTGGQHCCWSACCPAQLRIIVTETVCHTVTVTASNCIYIYQHQLNTTYFWLSSSSNISLFHSCSYNGDL